MCGIAGFFKSTAFNKSEALDQLKLMNNTINHRGPDDSGYFIDSEKGIAFAHKRLSIVDLSCAGSQPMESSNGRFLITYNGEIYNANSLKKELNNSGHIINWKGHSDTEVLINAIQVWGIKKTLNSIIGMFAFGLFDNHKKELYLVRDRIGEKPLYYSIIGNSIVFGSELKSVRKFKEFKNNIDQKAFNLFLRYGYVPSPFSIYKGTKKLNQGTFIRIKVDQNNRLLESQEVFWKLEDSINESRKNLFRGTLDEASYELENILDDTIKDQMIADVELGSFLSGGIDSSLITALMQKNNSRKIKTFSIGFENKIFNESIYAGKVANILGTKHTEYQFKEKDALEIIPTLNDVYDEPFADSSQIPTILLSKLARKDLKVALSGDGGDELFGGYNRYSWFNQIYSLTNFVSKDIRKKFAKKLKFIESDKTYKLINIFGSFFGKEALLKFNNKLIKLNQVIDYADEQDLYLKIISLIYDIHKFSSNCTTNHANKLDYFKDLNCSISSLMALDTIHYLPDDILVKVDRAAMSFGLETRIPFLDKRVLEFAWSLPLEMKIKGLNKKIILKKILEKYLPANLIYRPKQGFAIPLGDWLRGPLRTWAESILNTEKFKKNQFLNVDVVNKTWEEHINGRRNNQYILWNILVIQSWMEQNI